LRVLLDVVEIISEKNPKLLRRLERLGIYYGWASGTEGTFSGILIRRSGFSEALHLALDYHLSLQLILIA